jgi:hypothetical protein
LTKLNLEEIDFLGNIQVSRIGQVKAGIPRMIKVVLPSVDKRNMVLDKTKILKELPEPWCKIYINKDLHPVYSKQNKRLRDRMMDLKKKPENKDKNIRIVKGKLMVENDVIDKNPFFV